MARWYASPSGLLFAVGCGLVGAAILGGGGWRWLVLPGLAALGIAVPRRFIGAAGRTDRVQGYAAATRKWLKRTDQASAALESRLVEQSRRSDELERAAEQRGREVARSVRRVHAHLSGELADLTEAVQTLSSDAAQRQAHTTRSLDELRGELDQLNNRITTFTSPIPGLHDRELTVEKTTALVDQVAAPLGIDVTSGQLHQQADRIRSLESIALGRIATTIEDILMRCLAAQAACAGNSRVDICEIGTLFGIGGLVVRDATVAWTERAVLTVIDPLAGYYGAGQLDPSTALPINRQVLDHNIALLGPSGPDVRVIEGLSTDESVLAAVREAEYDLLIIDGDHSYDGVRQDFELYADHIRPGGILVVDDYGSNEWPAVTKYADEAIIPDERFDLVAAWSRTALLRRVGPSPT